MLNRKNRIASVVVAVAMVLAFLLAVAVGLPMATTAFAERSTTDWVVVDEIVKGNSAFSESNLKSLYQALAGVDTIEALGEKFGAGTGKEVLTSADFRAQNGGTNNVSVYFGGMKWDAVYLTKAPSTVGNVQAGDIILDLWRSADNLSTDMDVSSYSDGWSSTDRNLTYPCNMYSTSKIRVETLNAGGKYALDGGETLSDSQPQDADNQYARFTMDSVSGSLTQYIAKPFEVGYQADEWDEATSNAYGSSKYYFSNDAYEEPISGGTWNYDECNYLDDRDNSRDEAAKYGAWQNDYLWLPSITETGVEDDVGDGLWDTDKSLRQAVFRGQVTELWLRSASTAGNTAMLQSVNGYFALVVEHESQSGSYYGARPALHLNLTQADRGSQGDASFTFELPDEEVLFTADPSGVVKAEIPITASNIVVPNGFKLTLFVKSANEAHATDPAIPFCVRCGSSYCDYTLSSTSSYSDNISFFSGYVDNGLPIWMQHDEGNVPLDEFVLTLTLQNVPSVAGVWTDTLTFTALLEPID